MQPPGILLKQLMFLKQKEEELEVFIDQVNRLTMDAYPRRDGWSAANVEVLVVEVFLKGCKDKFVALMAANSQPKSLAGAVQRVR